MLTGCRDGQSSARRSAFAQSLVHWPRARPIMRRLPPRSPRFYPYPDSPITLARLFVEPDVLAAMAVEDAVGHYRQPLDIGLPAGPAARIEDDRPCAVFSELAFDGPDQLRAALPVALDRLPFDQLVDFRVAVAVPVEVRAAPIKQIQGRVGVWSAGLEVETAVNSLRRILGK